MVTTILMKSECVEILFLHSRTTPSVQSSFVYEASWQGMAGLAGEAVYLFLEIMTGI
jgi:hypothetical protein